MDISTDTVQIQILYQGAGSRKIGEWYDKRTTLVEGYSAINPVTKGLQIAIRI